MTDQELEEMRRDPDFELGFQIGRFAQLMAMQAMRRTEEEKQKFENEFLKAQIRLVQAGKMDISQIKL